MVCVRVHSSTFEQVASRGLTERLQRTAGLQLVDYLYALRAEMVHDEIKSEFGTVLLELRHLGFAPVDSLYDEVSGNWYVDFEGPYKIRVIKDRRQFIVDGDQNVLTAAGLWRAFNSLPEFASTLLQWAAT